MTLRSAYRIAAHFRIFDVERLLGKKNKDSEQLWRWLWYEQIEPFGELRADWRSAQVTAMVHNSPRKEQDQKKAEHFLLKFGEKAKAEVKQSVDEQIMILNILASVMAAPGVDD